MSDNIADNLKRHWHGTAGDRYEHLNVWTNGGSKGPASRAAWALTPEMQAAEAKRRESVGSASSANSGSPTTPSVHDRRRSSAGSGSGAGLFSSLSSQKRESADANMAARRASWNEQREQGGFFSKLWEGYTRGSK
ncbi:uncharacterized protein N7496_000591 [Penicillium cataractarum]|uniref:Uncharacterized protein n=1 Tax=Penicillium cataractarum TaxID=2100454 RepID=A0A9X0B630_9EURO|nr:uncharacterized protein N7496_000591 [Penicillium cataractarum]KAJ5389523.1 hypothetical protein N7496_000591 [Penicillium cataractarum]